MGWMGKIVGGALGFAMGGPLGAVAGALFGHAFDKGSELESQDGVFGGARLSDDEQSQLFFFVAAFSMLAKLVQADGEITRKELDTIENIMAKDLKLNVRSRNVAVNIFNTALHSSQSFQDYAAQFQGRFSARPQILEFMLDLLFKVSTAGGKLGEREEALLLAASKMFQFADSKYENIKSRYVKTADRFYAVLGCSPSDPDEIVKSRYRKLVREFHPDAIAAKGLPEEFTQFAQDKFREIQQAYEGIKLARGIK
jgi:DnaJ like chaperone protein